MLSGCLAPWLPSSVVPWLPGSLVASWLTSCLAPLLPAAWLPGSLAAWLPSCLISRWPETVPRADPENPGPGGQKHTGTQPQSFEPPRGQGGDRREFSGPHSKAKASIQVPQPRIQDPGPGGQKRTGLQPHSFRACVFGGPAGVFGISPLLS